MLGRRFTNTNALSLDTSPSLTPTSFNANLSARHSGTCFPRVETSASGVERRARSASAEELRFAERSLKTK